MRQIMLAAAVAGTALVGDYSSAAAQIVVETPGEVYVTRRYRAVPDEDAHYVYERSYVYERAPRVYRYYRAPADEEVVIRRAPRRGGCGADYYWDGSTCVEVRFR
jgi:hypothetical protein